MAGLKIQSEYHDLYVDFKQSYIYVIENIALQRSDKISKYSKNSLLT